MVYIESNDAKEPWNTSSLLMLLKYNEFPSSFNHTKEPFIMTKGVPKDSHA